MDKKSYNLQVNDYYSLLNLHKILLEAKFHPNPENPLVAGSSFLADLYGGVVSLLLQSEKASDWKEWLQLKNRTDYRQRAILQMKQNREWKDALPERKKIMARNYLAPFLYTEAELEEAINEVDKSLSENIQLSDAVLKKIETITDKESFREFLDLLAKYHTVTPKWEDKTIPNFIVAMSVWIEGYSEMDYNDINWEQLDYQALAKILYMGKLWE